MPSLQPVKTTRHPAVHQSGTGLWPPAWTWAVVHSARLSQRAGAVFRSELVHRDLVVQGLLGRQSASKQVVLAFSAPAHPSPSLWPDAASP